jgi:mRNA interferase MazF
MAVKHAGQIVLFQFPQTDLGIGKMRPAILLAPLPSDYDDWLVCMMSSKTRQAVSGIDELVSTNDTDFDRTGLKTDTVIRLTRLAVVSDSIFTGTIGEINSDRLGRLKTNLAQWIENS